MMIYQKAWRQAYVVGNLSRNNLIREDFPQRISQLKQTIQALSIDMKKTFSWNGMAKVEPNTTIPDTHLAMKFPGMVWRKLNLKQQFPIPYSLGQH
jgi:hypothetical protein